MSIKPLRTILWGLVLLSIGTTLISLAGGSYGAAAQWIVLAAALAGWALAEKTADHWRQVAESRGIDRFEGEQ